MKILNSHLGGALPMLLQRMGNQLAWEAPETPETPSLAARRMWYDTVGHAHPPALRCAAGSLGADRLVLGTDFPYQSGAAYQRAVSYLTTSGLPPATPATFSPPTPRHCSAGPPPVVPLPVAPYQPPRDHRKDTSAHPGAAGDHRLVARNRWRGGSRWLPQAGRKRCGTCPAGMAGTFASGGQRLRVAGWPA
jgi:hypothetical protein